MMSRSFFRQATHIRTNTLANTNTHGISISIGTNISTSITRRWLSDDLRARIDKAIKSTDVLVFMKGTKEAPQCGFSNKVVQILNHQGVDFKTVNVLADETVRAGIKEYSSWPTVPQVYVKGEFVGGCDIMMNMMESGELTRLLTDKGLLPAKKD